MGEAPPAYGAPGNWPPARGAVANAPGEIHRISEHKTLWAPALGYSLGTLKEKRIRMKLQGCHDPNLNFNAINKLTENA